MARFNITELDFDKIKESIKEHFKNDSQDRYNDWDFEGSTLNVLLNILAYNTHYNAMNSHMALNESFLDSAQIRGNVVSKAKALGYTPRSLLGASAVVTVTVTAGTNPPAFITLPRGQVFVALVDGVRYEFVNLESYEAPLVSGTYVFTNVALKQGQIRRQLFVVDETIENQRFTITDPDVDTTTLQVRVKDTAVATQYTNYTPFANYGSITSTSTVYFIQENSLGLYEVYFGDGILGKKVLSNNVVELEYCITNGTEANGARSFTVQGSIGGYSNSVVSVDDVATGGADRESIESIRYNAPLTFITQNRAVTADDYRSIILQGFGGVETIAVWGGEDNETPNFGKVYIAIKPTDAETLSAAQKDFILKNILQNKTVMSVEPVLVDPEYTYISLDALFKFNPNLTDLGKVGLEDVVRATIQQYNDDVLEKFDGVFRSSQLMGLIDNCNPAILNSVIRVYMAKYFTPTTTATNYVELQYPSTIYRTTSSNPIMISSSFDIDGVEHYLSDEPNPSSVSSGRIVYLYRRTSTGAIKVKQAGSIEPTSGLVIISGFTPDTNAQIRIEVQPDSNDLAPKRNQLLSLDTAYVTVTGDIDTIAVAGPSGVIRYSTFSRHR